MIYYKVKKEFDQHYKNPKIHDGNILIADELYTEKELKKLPFVPLAAFERVEISKNNIYWCFGARFAE